MPQPSTPLSEATSVLEERAAYLAERVIAKKKVGWEWQYDERERAALRRVLDAVDSDATERNRP